MNLESTLETEKAKIPEGMKRSDKWPKARAAHLKQFPTCAVCGGTEKIEIHHCKPFHLHPELELDPTNFISLCEANKDGFDCHLGIGHNGSFKAYNPNVREDAALFNKRIKERLYE